jgi:hypothetical protein
MFGGSYVCEDSTVVTEYFNPEDEGSMFLQNIAPISL